MASQPFAVFDIDGTLIRWQLYHAVADELARRGHLDGIQFERVMQARTAWKNRSQQTSFRDYERTLVNLIDVSIQSISVEDLEAASRTVISEYKDQVYIYTRDLMVELKKQGYLLFAISGSPSNIVGQIAEYYGFDDFGGTQYEAKHGMFTGKKELLISTRKPMYLQKLVQKHEASYEGSIGLGDSEGDIPMLSVVEKPITFNPSRDLFEHAKEHHWDVILERKNMIYEMKFLDGHYQLSA
jgi:HAD superfamily hydrolase (TIGR01490 family)